MLPSFSAPHQQNFCQMQCLKVVKLALAYLELCISWLRNGKDETSNFTPEGSHPIYDLLFVSLFIINVNGTKRTATKQFSGVHKFSSRFSVGLSREEKELKRFAQFPNLFCCTVQDLSKTTEVHCHIIQEVGSSWYEGRYISRSLLRFLISCLLNYLYIWCHWQYSRHSCC